MRGYKARTNLEATHRQFGNCIFWEFGSAKRPPAVNRRANPPPKLSGTRQTHLQSMNFIQRYLGSARFLQNCQQFGKTARRAGEVAIAAVAIEEQANAAGSDVQQSLERPARPEGSGAVDQKLGSSRRTRPNYATAWKYCCREPGWSNNNCGRICRRTNTVDSKTTNPPPHPK